MLKLAAGVALVSLVLSMGARLLVTAPASLLAPPATFPLPAAALAHLPLLGQIAPIRFALLTALFVGLAVSIVLDRLHGTRATAPAAGKIQAAPTPGEVADARPVWTVLALFAVAAFVAVGPAWTSSFPARQLLVPAAYRSPTLERYPTASTLVGYPYVTNFATDPLAWQALSGYRYKIFDGSAYVPGPDGKPTLGLPDSVITLLFAAAALDHFPASIGRPTQRALRRQLAAWHTDEVVVLPGVGQSTQLAAFLAAALHRRPSRAGGAWVFTDLRAELGATSG